MLSCNYWVGFPAGIGLWNSTECTASFESLANIQQVSCNLTTSSNVGRVYTVVLRELPRYPAENNIFYYAGGLTAASLATAMQCDTALVTGGTDGLGCSVSLVNPNATFPGVNVM